MKSQSPFSRSSTAITTTSPDNLSLCIPFVFQNITTERIAEAFKKAGIGKVNHIDLIAKKNPSTDLEYNTAYVHFDNWYGSEFAIDFQKQVILGEAKLQYDGRWFWKVYENKGVKKLEEVIEEKEEYNGEEEEEWEEEQDENEKAEEEEKEKIFHELEELRKIVEKEGECKLVSATYVATVEKELANVHVQNACLTEENTCYQQHIRVLEDRILLMTQQENTLLKKLLEMQCQSPHPFTNVIPDSFHMKS